MSTRVVKGSMGWMFDTGSNLMSAACHHQSKGACGGCYARAIETLSAISEDDGTERARAVILEIKQEAK